MLNFFPCTLNLSHLYFVAAHTNSLSSVTYSNCIIFKLDVCVPKRRKKIEEKSVSVVPQIKRPDNRHFNKVIRIVIMCSVRDSITLFKAAKTEDEYA